MLGNVASTLLHNKQDPLFPIWNILSSTDETSRITSPGATMEIEASCTVRRNNLGIGQAIDLAGEQTYMKSAKTSGNYLFSLIKILASSVEVILFNILNMKIINNKLYLLQVVSHCLLHSPQQSRNGF